MPSHFVDVEYWKVAIVGVTHKGQKAGNQNKLQSDAGQYRHVQPRYNYVEQCVEQCPVVWSW